MSNGHSDGHSNGQGDVAALQADIERTREELAETVDQLAAKLDVMTRVRDSMTTADGRPTATVLVASGAALAGVVAFVVLVVRRKRG